MVVRSRHGLERRQCGARPIQRGHRSSLPDLVAMMLSLFALADSSLVFFGKEERHAAVGFVIMTTWPDSDGSTSELTSILRILLILSEPSVL